MAEKTAESGFDGVVMRREPDHSDREHGNSRFSEQWSDICEPAKGQVRRDECASLPFLL